MGYFQLEDETLGQHPDFVLGERRGNLHFLETFADARQKRRFASPKRFEILRPLAAQFQAHQSRESGNPVWDLNGAVRGDIFGDAVSELVVDAGALFIQRNRRLRSNQRVGDGG